MTALEYVEGMSASALLRGWTLSHSAHLPLEAALSLIAEIDSRASAELNATSIGSGPCQFKANADLDVATLKSAVVQIG